MQRPEGTETVGQVVVQGRGAGAQGLGDDDSREPDDPPTRRRRTAAGSDEPRSALTFLAVCGSGQGLFAVPFFTTALHRVRPHETGSAAGLLNAAQQLGGTLGIALLGTIFLHAASDGPSEPARAVLNGARNAFWVSVGLIAATGVAAALLHAASRSNRGRGTEEGG